MANVVKGKDVILYFFNGTIYKPIACAKDATITITADYLETAPATNTRSRTYVANRLSGSISGSGLTKVVGDAGQATIFDALLLQLAGTPLTVKYNVTDGTNTKYFEVNTIVEEITLTTQSIGFATYNFKLLINGNINLI